MLWETSITTVKARKKNTMFMWEFNLRKKFPDKEDMADGTSSGDYLRDSQSS